MNNLLTIIMLVLNRILQNYINIINVGTNKQGSKEWHENRKKTIGSSEIYDISGTSSQQSKIVDKKLGRLPDIYGIDAIVWGNLFESSSKIVTEVIMGCTIYNVNGSIIHTGLTDDDGNFINSDSPDGLGVVAIPAKLYKDYITPIHISDTDLYGNSRFPKKTQDRKKFITSFIYATGSGKKITEEYKIPSDSASEICMIAHFEFKSPISRKIEPEKISESYLFQKLSGLDVFKSAKVGIFSEVKFGIVYPFKFSPIKLTDVFRSGSEHPCYFAMTKYIVMLDGSTYQQIMPYNGGDLRDKKATQDYKIIDGPFMYYLGGEFEFRGNNFIAELDLIGYEYEKPNNVDDFNQLCDDINKKLSGSGAKHYIYHEIQEFSIKIIRKMPGFLENFRDPCIATLDRIKCQQ